MTATHFTVGKYRVGWVPFLKVLTVMMYVAGALGLSWETTRPVFQALTPWNLLFTGFLLILFQPERNRPFWIFAALAASLGFGAEVLGVATGFPFGDYVYGPTLGLKLFAVPLTIALNWLVLAYVCGDLVYRYLPKLFWGLQSILAATLMVALDVLIEPVAIRYDFWSWANGNPPLQNYLGWFGVALLVQVAFFQLPFGKGHPLGTYFLWLQVLFFSLCLILV